MNWTEGVEEQASKIGFDFVGFAPARPALQADAFRRWLGAGCAAGLSWMAKDVERRLKPGAKSVIVAGLNYFVQNPPPEVWNDPSRGRIARYAWGGDYHDVMLPMLNELAEYVRAEIGRPATFKTYVDTGPVLERDLATQVGLGFIGKNTNLIHPNFGSYVFLGEILTDLEDADFAAPVSARKGFRSFKRQSCGRCARCLEACPTRAFPEPYVLDARRCISYLTIEHKGPIPEDLRPRMSNWIFGCDECQQACPWVRQFSKPGRQRFLRFDENRCAPKLVELMTLDEAGFRKRFSGTPVLRAKRSGWLRNVAVALGNWGDPSSVPVLDKTAHDLDPLVREHAQWALEKIRRGRGRNSHLSADAFAKAKGGDGPPRSPLVRAPP
jgi:epoxyqueuosine reductase